MLLEDLGLLLLDEVIPPRLQWLEFRQILRVGLRIRGHADDRQLVGLDGTGEDTVEGVIIARGNRIVLVVVATSAAHGERQHPPRNRINAVVKGVVNVVLELPAAGQEPKTGQSLFVLAKVELIRGELLDKEFIVGQIVIERTNDVIAVGEGMGAVGTGVSSHIQPVTAPAFAVVPRGEQTIHDCCERLRGLVRHEGRDFLGCRRQTDQVISSPANQGSLVRRLRWLHSSGFQFGQDKRINR